MTLSSKKRFPIRWLRFCVRKCGTPSFFKFIFLEIAFGQDQDFLMICTPHDFVKWFAQREVDADLEKRLNFEREAQIQAFEFRF